MCWLERSVAKRDRGKTFCLSVCLSYILQLFPIFLFLTFITQAEQSEAKSVFLSFFLTLTFTISKFVFFIPWAQTACSFQWFSVRDLQKLLISGFIRHPSSESKMIQILMKLNDSSARFTKRSQVQLQLPFPFPAGHVSPVLASVSPS